MLQEHHLAHNVKPKLTSQDRQSETRGRKRTTTLNDCILRWPKHAPVSLIKRKMLLVFVSLSVVSVCICLLSLVLVCWDRVYPCAPDWTGTHWVDQVCTLSFLLNASQVLGLQVCATLASQRTDACSLKCSKTVKDSGTSLTSTSVHIPGALLSLASPRR